MITLSNCFKEKKVYLRFIKNSLRNVAGAKMKPIETNDK